MTTPAQMENIIVLDQKVTIIENILLFFCSAPCDSSGLSIYLEILARTAPIEAKRYHIGAGGIQCKNRTRVKVSKVPNWMAKA